MSELSPEEINRYQRHLTLPDFGETAQLKLKASSVLVVGAGGLGCPALQYLAAAGVGKLGIIDFDTVDVSNLQRQVLYRDSDEGKPKADIAAERLREMNPFIEVLSIRDRLTVDNALELFNGYDLILDGSDNFTTRYLVNDACVMAGKPLIYGAIYTFQGQVSVFNYESGPTYRCLFPEPPDPKDAPNCSEIGVLGVLPGLIGTAQACEAIKVLAGIGEPLRGRLLIWDTLTMKQQIIKFNRNDSVANVTQLEEINYHCEVSMEEQNNEIGVEEFSEWQTKYPDLQVVDVREGWERALSKIDDTEHIPLGGLVNRVVDLKKTELDPGKKTVVYCKAGARSLVALEAMITYYGFTDIVSLAGGITLWENYQRLK